MLYIYDCDAVFPKKIPFAFVLEEIICWTRHGVPVMGYRFVDESRKTIWECPLGYEAGEKAVRFAKLRDRFCPYEDQFDWAGLYFDKMCKDNGVEFKDYWERKEFYQEFCEGYLKDYGKDYRLFGKSSAYRKMVNSAPGGRKT